MANGTADGYFPDMQHPDIRQPRARKPMNAAVARAVSQDVTTSDAASGYAR